MVTFGGYVLPTPLSIVYDKAWSIRDTPVPEGKVSFKETEAFSVFVIPSMINSKSTVQNQISNMV